MSVVDVAAVLLTLSALLGYCNYRFLKLPSTIGLMVMALGASLLVVGADRMFPTLHLAAVVSGFVGEIDFNRALMEGMLGVLLFAGALHVDLGDLLSRGRAIAMLATLGVMLSTVAVAALIYPLFHLLGLEVPFLHCLLFGALISPTDPIAVLGILKNAGAGKGLTAKITGESLFNDGVAVVLFTALVAVAFGLEGHDHMGAAEIAGLFVEEVAGGMLLGLAAGYAAFRLIRDVDDYPLEVLITLALVLGVSSLAPAIHVSGPLAVVVAGLFIGNHGKRFAMSEATAQHVNTFWTLNDEILNAVLFLLIGLEVFAVSLSPTHLLAGVLAIPVCLLARFASVGLPISALRGVGADFPRGTVRGLTWAGLKGGVSVALVLSLPPFPHKAVLVAATYMVVMFSIVAQGLTVGPVIRRLMRRAA